MFADEAGNFDFSEGPSASRYFILTTVTMEDCAVGEAMLALRRDLAMKGVHLPSGYFHAAEDEQAVRDQVFALLAGHEFRVDAVILKKANVVDRLRRNNVRFYKTAWWLHFKHVAPLIATPGDELLVVAATLGTRKKQELFRSAVNDVADQVVSADFKVGAWSAASDPCLQVADYCSWAIQRKWERKDARSHALIAPKIQTEYGMFLRAPRTVPAVPVALRKA